MIRLKPLADQVVVVMGASSGIGRRTATDLALRGARVVVSARDAASLKEVVEQIEQWGGRALAAPADVTDFEQVQAVASRAVEHYGALDTWVHSSAIAMAARFEDTAPEEFARVHEVNFLGTVHGALAALPHLRKTGRGALIHISSIEGYRGVPYQSAYASSKYAVNGVLETLRTELFSEGVPIAVTRIMPGAINTPLFAKSRNKTGLRFVPPPPVYSAATVADMVRFACEHPSTDLFAGGSSAVLSVLQRLSPRLVDLLLILTGPRFQLEKGNDVSGDNFFEPLSGLAAVDGPYHRSVRTSSSYNWFERHNPLQRLNALWSGWSVRPATWRPGRPVLQKPDFSQRKGAEL